MHTNYGIDSREKFQSVWYSSTLDDNPRIRINDSRYRLFVPSREAINVQSKRKPQWASLSGLVFLFLAMLVSGVVGVGRLGTLPEPVDLPDRYLPGNPLPKHVACYTPIDEHLLCFVQILDREVYFNFDTRMRRITRTGIPMRGYTLGRLIAVWGTPGGIIRTDNTDAIYICWGKRFALLYARSLRPDDRVEYIVYDPELSPVSPWRGFTDRQI